ncbi:MAG: zinc ABC transporter substrate-binding protein [Burkholderiales bacterium]|nr:zinc ABC transporter substrate-binding protein [Burkholderiales bacterium]
MTMNRRRALGLGGAALAALHPSASRAQSPAPRIVASFSILADMAQELAPAGAQVTALVGADADAHVYEPSPADGKRLARADLVVVNGLGFEGWIERMVKVSGYRGTLAVASQGIQPRKGDHRGADPHAWQDLALARRYATNLSAAFALRWPQQRDEIARRGADYLARIDGLDRQVRDWLGVVPRPQRRVITSHDAFGYFGAAYGVDFLAAQGWNTHSEPSAAAVARLIRQIRKEGVRAIFIENISDPRLVERIAREGGVRVGGTLYSDALSGPDGPAATYLRMIEHNARGLAAALQA